MMAAPQPARPPVRTVIEGRYARLEPLGQRHAADLYEAASGPGTEASFAYLPDYPPADEAEMAAWIERVAPQDDPLFFAVIDKGTGRAEGRQALMRIVPEHGVIELGSIRWGPAIAMTRAATEAFYLSARHVFDDLGYRRFEWKCNDRNEPSKRAALRFGFTFEGLFRQHMIVKGENRDTAWFAMLDGDWPRLKAGYERWLHADNFDANGMQKSKLRFG
jgi:RimJ/RimL family protein N-acetyltransferase